MLNAKRLRPTDPGQSVVLLAEDDVMVLTIARITLEKEGYFVLTAENGDAALYLSRQVPCEIHLLLTDVRMPKMGGVELSKVISVERPSTRIVLMSGYTSGEDINPNFPFLRKPFGPRLLSETVKGLVPSRQKSE
jgi:two-component system, cell cycle sensor histidine kinase and response regulator CckA